MAGETEAHPGQVIAQVYMTGQSSAELGFKARESHPRVQLLTMIKSHLPKEIDRLLQRCSSEVGQPCGAVWGVALQSQTDLR